MEMIGEMKTNGDEVCEEQCIVHKVKKATKAKSSYKNSLRAVAKRADQ